MEVLWWPPFKTWGNWGWERYNELSKITWWKNQAIHRSLSLKTCGEPVHTPVIPLTMGTLPFPSSTGYCSAFCNFQDLQGGAMSEISQGYLFVSPNAGMPRLPLGVSNSLVWDRVTCSVTFGSSLSLSVSIPESANEKKLLEVPTSLAVVDWVLWEKDSEIFQPAIIWQKGEPTQIIHPAKPSADPRDHTRQPGLKELLGWLME